MAGCRLVAYYRVSSGKQGQSGLGLGAQREAVARYAATAGCGIVADFTEVETGRRADRPELAKAIAHAKRTKSTLVIAKLDRLARDTAFLLALIDGGADVAFCDLPSVPAGATGRFLLTQMAAVAELEAGLTSERTKAALAAYKAERRVSRRIREAYPAGVPADVAEARAGRLGASLPECRDNLTRESRLKGSAAAGRTVRAKANAAYADLLPTIRELRDGGATVRTIAERLNADGHTTREGTPFGPVQVHRILKRADAE